MYKPDGHNIAKRNICITFLQHNAYRAQWRSQGGGSGGGGGGGGGGHGGHGPPKLLVVNFPINLRCYVLLGCRVINVILAINIGDSAFFGIADSIVGFRHVHYGYTWDCTVIWLNHIKQWIHWPPPKPKSWLRHWSSLILATARVLPEETQRELFRFGAWPR